MIEHTEQFFVCKFKTARYPSVKDTPWAGLDQSSGGYLYETGRHFLDTGVHRWPLSQRADVFRYARQDLDVYLVTISFRRNPGEGSYFVNSSAVLAWPPDDGPRNCPNKE